jgi:hypothetical protein
MSAASPTTRERLATLEAVFKDLDSYVRNDLTHRINRIEAAHYGLIVGVAGILLLVLLEIVTR